jgi:hypothetical protein
MSPNGALTWGGGNENPGGGASAGLAGACAKAMFVMENKNMIADKRTE